MVVLAEMQKEDTDMDVEMSSEANVENGTNEPKKPGKGKSKELLSALDCYQKLGVIKDNTAVIDIATKLLKFANTNKEEHPYVLRRLVLGMTSVSKVSQQNHFVCLVEFLRQNNITFYEVEDIVQQYLKPIRTRTTEESMVFLARILTYLAVFRSGMPLSQKDKKYALDMTLSYGGKRNFLCVLALKGIVENVVDYEEIATGEEMFKQITSLNPMGFNIRNATLDTLHFICFVLNNCNLDPKTINMYFGFKDTADTFFDNASKVIMGSSETIEFVLSHPFMNELVILISKRSIVREFLAKMIPEALENKHMAPICLEIVSKLLKNSPEDYQDLLSPQVLSLIYRFGERERELKRPIVETPLIIQLNTMIKNDQITSKAMLLKLIKCSITWDKCIPGNMLLTLFNKADKELLTELEGVLRTIFKGNELSAKRVYAAGLLSKMVGHTALVEDIPKRIAILELLFQHTVVNIDDPTFHPFLNAALSEVNDIFFRALDNSCKTFAEQIKIVESCMAIAIKLQSKFKFTKEAEENWTQVTKLVSTLSKKWQKDENKETGVFLLLFCNIGLQLFSQPKMAVDILSDLFPLYSDWSKSKKSKGKDPSGYELVVDIMISLLAQSKHFLRSLVKVIFRVLSGQMTQPAIQVLLDAIGDDSVADKDEDMDDEEDSEDDNESEGEENKEEKTGEDKSDNENSEDSEEDEDEEENIDAELDSDLKAKIQNALGEHAEASDEESDIDMDEVPEQDMNNLDKILSQAFKALGGRKLPHERKRESLDYLAKQHFKLRVLELIEIHLHHGATLQNISIIIPGLLDRYAQVYTNNQDAPIAAKIKTILTKFASTKLSVAAGEGVSTSELLDYLLKYCCNKTYINMKLQNTVPKLCHQILKSNLTDCAATEKIYMDKLKEYYASEGTETFVNHELFISAVSLSWTGAHKVATEILNKTFSAEAKSYQVGQGLAILTSYIQNLNLKEKFSTEYNKITKNIKTKALSKLSDRLSNSKPNDLIQFFELLRFFKKQDGFLTKKQVESIQADLETFSTSDFKFLSNNKVKKQLNKTRIMFGLKPAIIAKPKKVKTKGVVSKPATVTEKKDENTNSNKTDNTEESADQPEKKKKKNKQKSKKEENDEDSEPVPSFAEFLPDPTKSDVFKEPIDVNEELPVKKNKSKKQKGEGNENKKRKVEDPESSPKKAKSSDYSLAEDDDSVDLFLRLFVAKRMDQLQAVKNILTLEMHKRFGTNKDLDLILKWSVGFVKEMSLLDDSTHRLLDLCSQEIGIIPKDPEFHNPYKIVKPAQKRFEDPPPPTKKPRLKLKRGPKMSKTEL